MQAIYDFEWAMEWGSWLRISTEALHDGIRDENDVWDPEYNAECNKWMISRPSGFLSVSFLLAREIDEWPEGDIGQPRAALSPRMLGLGMIW